MPDNNGSPNDVPPAVIARIKAFLGRDGTLQPHQEVAPYTLPFLGKPAHKVLMVQHSVAIPGTGKSLEMKVYFSPDGQFLRAESLSVMADARRRDVEALEKSLRKSAEAIVGWPQPDWEFDFPSFWANLCRRYSMEDAREFNLTLVEYRFFKGTQKPVLVLNIWGLDNPLGISVPAPPIAKNRVRVLYDLNGKAISSDNIL